MRLNYKILTILGLFSLTFSVLGNSLDSLRLEVKDGQSYIVHKIDQGQTLYAISKRYSADIESIITVNKIVGNQISIGQELMIPYAKTTGNTDTPSSEESSEINTNLNPKTNSNQKHTVTTGETLYSLSRKYSVEVDAMKKANQMSGNELSVGQVLIIPTENSGVIESSGIAEIPEETSEPIITETPKPKAQEEVIPNGFTVYYVQTGESLETIAGRFSVRPDSVVHWNKLPNSYLSIGQKLLIRGKLDQAKLLVKDDVEELPYGTRRKVTDSSGFTKIFEEGSASKIETKSPTEKYLALHRTLGVGSLIEVRNLMNNQKIFVRIVGKLPETGLNRNVMIRLSPICFERLGVIDPKTRVEVSYFLD